MILVIERFNIPHYTLLIVSIALIDSFDYRPFCPSWVNIFWNWFNDLCEHSAYFYCIGNSSVLALKDSAESAISQYSFYFISMIETLSFFKFVMSNSMSPFCWRRCRSRTWTWVARWRRGRIRILVSPSIISRIRSSRWRWSRRHLSTISSSLFAVSTRGWSVRLILLSSELNSVYLSLLLGEMLW